MLDYEIAAALAEFFDYRDQRSFGPTHDVVGRLIAQAGFEAVDPRYKDADPNAGKKKRIREVLFYAATEEVDAGGRLVRSLLGAMRSCGSFRPGSDNYPGHEVVEALRQAFARQGFELDPEGNLHSTVIDDLEGAERTAALWAYVRRFRTGATDAPLTIGNSKDLTEAVARHVLNEVLGAYSTHMNFPDTLFLAFDRLGLGTPPSDVFDALDHDGWRAVEQALCVLGVAVNRLRNQQGTGHGRPEEPSVTIRQSRLVCQ